MGDFDKAVFDKTDEPLIVTSKLASEQELLQSIVPHYAPTSRSERKSFNLKVVGELKHSNSNICSHSGNIFCIVQHSIEILACAT